MAENEIVPVPANALELVHPDGDGFKQKVDPKKIDGKIFLFRCSKILKGDPADESVPVERCNNPHLRHAGYVKNIIPIMRTQQLKEVVFESVNVHVCTKCRSCYIHVDGQTYDVTEHIDLQAWEKVELEMDKAIGPGGNNC